MKLPYIKQADEESANESDISKLFWDVLPIERATSFIQYKHDSSSHNILVSLKYKHRPDIGVKMGELMAEELKDTGFFNNIDFIVPIPLHWTRYWKRGYNQSERLAVGLSNIIGIPIERKAVKRIRANATQTNLDKEQREKNVEGIFKVKDISRIHGKHILLIDDVLTTGATMISCGSAIAKADPSVKMSILTLARAKF